ncbi:MAG: hypothetical protein V2A34_04435, partial [Lentisphaerota bacterium]
MTKLKVYHVAGVLAGLLGLTDVDACHAAIRYVHATNATPQFPYTTPNTAAQRIQDAVNASGMGDVIRVGAGVYSNGGTAVAGQILPNRVWIVKPITVESVEGALATRIVGCTNAASPMRCAYVANGAVLRGFTLAQGATQAGQGMWNADSSGGGAFVDAGAQLLDCIVTG